MAEQTNLNRDGCEYGKLLGRDVSHMREDIDEIKKDVKEIGNKLDSLALSVAEKQAILSQTIKSVVVPISVAVSATITYITARFMNILGGGK